MIKIKTPLLQIQNVSKHFHCSQDGEMFTALRNVSLEIEEGKLLLIAGSNGSGKTLLIKIAAGLLEPDAGDVFFRGQALYNAKQSRVKRRETEKSLRRKLGIVFQDADTQIVGQTVTEDVLFGPENLGFSAIDAKARADNAIASLGLSEKCDNPPRRLSGGEKRRLAIAGVLAMGCAVIIMDEPFANLDWPGVVQTIGIINDLKKSGITLIILTHELEKILSLADRLVILHRGYICDDDPPAEVLDRLDPAWGVRDPRSHIQNLISGV